MKNTFLISTLAATMIKSEHDFYDIRRPPVQPKSSLTAAQKVKRKKKNKNAKKARRRKK